MIAGRAEATYQGFDVDESSHVLSFTFAIGASFRDPVTLHLQELQGVAESNGDSYFVELGPKLVRIWNGPVRGEGSVVIEWFTTEKLIWDRARGRAGIRGFERFREAATYALLYVGIAKVGDSFDRLIKNGHKARQEILSSEPQRHPGARVTDEIFLFLFRAEPLFITTFERDHDFDDDDVNPQISPKRIVADAEKAFVSLLKPEYNLTKFRSYPKGSDGLYGSEFVRYGYTINECLSFLTPHGRLRGSRDQLTGLPTNDSDLIFVEGETVQLFISGVDFPSEGGQRPERT